MTKPLSFTTLFVACITLLGCAGTGGIRPPDYHNSDSSVLSNEAEVEGKHDHFTSSSLTEKPCPVSDDSPVTKGQLARLAVVVKAIDSDVTTQSSLIAELDKRVARCEDQIGNPTTSPSDVKDMVSEVRDLRRQMSLQNLGGSLVAVLALIALVATIIL